MDGSLVSTTRFLSRHQQPALHQCRHQFLRLLPRALHLLCLASLLQNQILDDLLTHPVLLLHRHLPQQRTPPRMMSMIHSTTVQHRPESPRCLPTPSLHLLHDVLRMLPRRARILARLLTSRLLLHLLAVEHHLRHALQRTHDRLADQWTC